MASLLRRVGAWAVLVTLLAAIGLGWMVGGHAGSEDDAACGPAPIAAAHPGVQFEAVKDAPVVTHCSFCHWQRAVGGADIVGLAPAIFQFNTVDRVPPSGFRVPRPAALDAHASRGPPSLT